MGGRSIATAVRLGQRCSADRAGLIRFYDEFLTGLPVLEQRKTATSARFGHNRKSPAGNGDLGR